MPILNWIGKEKVINHHLDVPFRVLEHQYGFENGNQSDREVSSGNKIIHGDNLEALKALLPEYEGKVKCIYIDQPYNTGNEDWIYNDNVNDPWFKKWLTDFVGRDDLSRHDKWLCMMYPRLRLLYKLLADDGVIFISLDEIETSHLRCIMNEIFGEANFIAQITLLCNPKGRSQDKYFSTNHEYITVYSKQRLPKDSFSISKDEELIEKEYKFSDEGGRYRLLELRNTHREFNRKNRPNLFYSFFIDPETGNVSLTQNDTFTIEKQPLWPDGYEGCWTWGKELATKDNSLLVARKNKNDWKIYRKSYATSTDGENAKRKLFTIWQDSRFYTEKGQSAFGEIFPGYNKNDFPQPKSVDLVMEILSTCTTENDLILDSFAGSGTTGHAVVKLNQKDGQNRKFILIEREFYANTITAERIKRVGNTESKKQNVDFDFYTLGPTLFDDHGVINSAVQTDKIRNYIFYTETTSSLQNKLHTDNRFFLDSFGGAAYYLFYDKEEVTTLNYDFLSSIKTKAEQYVIYADNCVLTKEFLAQHKIIFKKIPRDITVF